VKKHLTLMMVSLAALTLAAGCNKEQQTAQPTEQKPAQQPAAGQGKSGKVVETMNAGGYTYVQVDTGSEKVWAAAPEFKVKVGDEVAIPQGMPMANYESKTLKRKFDVVYFVDSIMVGGVPAQGAANPAAMQQGGMPQGHPPVAAQATEKISGIAKADMTVAELFAGKAKLAGKQIGVRGKVVKFSPEIMGKNWIHLQDGSGAQGSNDLTVTTKATVKVGDTVLVTGPVSVGKDFGYGYKYEVIIEDAQVKAE
jgi:ribosomal protein S17